MYADFSMCATVDHPQGVFCKCGRTVHLKESEASNYDNLITCPVCGYQIHLICPKSLYGIYYKGEQKMIKTFVKKPVEIQAVQWTGYNYGEIVDFVGANSVGFCAGYVKELKLIIFTLEGDHYASVGDWIIRGVMGEFYPCKPDVFEQTYEEIVK